jgi:hypothetical protein
VIGKLKAIRLPKAAEIVERGIDEMLAYFAFPEEHWRRLGTNNPLERIMREIRRRTRVVGAFPNGQSSLSLASARLRHIAGTRWSTKRYLNMQLLKQRDIEMQAADRSGRHPNVRKDLDTPGDRANSKEFPQGAALKRRSFLKISTASGVGAYGIRRTVRSLAEQGQV